MRRLLPLFLLVLTLSLPACRPREERIPELKERVFSLAREQLLLLDASLPAGRCPKTFEDGTLQTSDVGWWCSGFFPGSLWLCYEYSGDPEMKELAIRHTEPLRALLEQHTDHDIGFQLMCSFGNRYRLTGEGREVLEQGAAKLASRYCPGAGVIRSWDFGEWEIPVIIDNMMNLELLMAFGDKEIARQHALNTARNHFRPDGTCFHLVDYAADGSVHGRQTVQGFADSTAWARGQAWALYGFALMARAEKEGGDEESYSRFYAVAAALEAWLLRALPPDGIPFWDFSQSDLKDASAAAIIACGLLEMSRLREESGGASRAMAERIIRTLASPGYLASPGTQGGFLLKHCVGNRPQGTEIDVPLTYADYYFLKALMELE